MFLTYHRVGRISVLPALAAAGAIVIIGGIATITLLIVGVAACGVWLLRAIGIGRAGRRVPSQDHEVIEGVVVHSTDVSDQLLRMDDDKG